MKGTDLMPGDVILVSVAMEPPAPHMIRGFAAAPTAGGSPWPNRYAYLAGGGMKHISGGTEYTVVRDTKSESPPKRTLRCGGAVS